MADYHHDVQDGVVDNEVDAVVHLLVDDVQGENTEGVMLLQGSGRTKLLEGTFRNLGKITISSVLQSVVELNLAVNNHIAHLGKDSVERIVSHVDRLLHLCQNVPARTSNVFFCCIYSIVLYQNSRRNVCRPSELLELVSEEHVCEVDLADDVGEVEELAGEELEEVRAALRLLLVEVPEG